MLSFFDQKSSRSYLYSQSKLCQAFLLLSFIVLTNQTIAQSFVNVANSAGAGAALAIGGNKDGGVAWGDINLDGCLDLVVNTHDGSHRTRILMADCSNPQAPSFSDQTNTLCRGLLATTLERSIILADVNGDGILDMARNSHWKVELYLNNGPTEGYSFGNGSNQSPDFSLITSNVNSASTGDIPGGMNTEGMEFMDYDGDGDLDLMLENHNWGIDLYANDGSGNFSYVDPTTVGLPTTAATGDYASCADYNNDGWVDILFRKENQTDLYTNVNGIFNTGTEIGQANNGLKGGAIFADFDNDSDFDFYWSASGTDQIWLQDGVNSGTFSPTKLAASPNNWGEPWVSAGISAPGNTDGCAVGDVNNDGKIDLMIGSSSGSGYLFINTTQPGASISFSRDNKGINFNGNAEGMAFADYDNDGDLDLYVNIKNKSNQLWENDLNDNGSANYLIVHAQVNLGGGISRPAQGANITVRDCNGDQLIGIREVATGTGHGSNPPAEVHFGLPSGPNEAYMVQVDFVSDNGLRQTVRKLVTPSQESGQEITILDTDASHNISCGTFPVELLDISVEQYDAGTLLAWRTAKEINSSHFVVERSLDGVAFSPLKGDIPAAGNSEDIQSYQFIDTDAYKLGARTLHYRLRQVDLDGAFQHSQVLSLQMEEPASILVNAFPNPATEKLQLHIRSTIRQFISWELLSLQGQRIQSGQLRAEDELYQERLQLQDLPAGIYLIQVQGEKVSKSL
ncbi:MAG: FG-GAP-like repeat-containing protein, partial [Bacteroidota bacterium]